MPSIYREGSCETAGYGNPHEGRAVLEITTTSTDSQSVILFGLCRLDHLGSAS